METVQAPPKGRRIPKWALPAFGYSVSAIALIWLFSRFPFAELGTHLRTMDWTWVAVAIVVEIGVYFFDAWRWMVLLGPVGSPSFGACLQAVFVGLLANDMLPAKAGEVVRCFLLSFKTKVPLSLALTSDVIERIMDGVWVVIVYLLITFQIGSHTMVNRAMWVFSGTVVTIAILLLWVLFHKQGAHRFVRNSGWGARFIHYLEEIHRLGHWRELGIAMAIGGLYWVAQIFAIWAIAKADDFDFSFSEVAFLLVVKTVGTLIPNAPANMGAYQAAIVIALETLFTDSTDAKILAEIIFGFLTLPLVIGGVIAIAFAGFNLSDLQRHAHHAHSTSKLKRKPGDDPLPPHPEDS